MNRRIEGLDVLRVVSAAVVCAFHTIMHLDCNYGILQPFLDSGAVFMSTFFILSGFSLTISNGFITNSAILRFYKKRAVAVVPMYYFCAILYNLMITIFAALAGGGVWNKIEQMILLAPIEALGLQTVFTSLFQYNHNAGTWFISCILLCYFIYPLLVGLVQLISRKERILISCLLTVLLVYSAFIAHRFGLADIYPNPFIRALEFSIGVLVGGIWTEHKGPKFSDRVYKTALLSLAILLIVCISLFSRLYDTYGYGCMMFSWIVIPVSSLSIYYAAQVQKWHFRGIILYLSKISYCFYLAQLFSNTLCKYIIGRYNISSNSIKIVLAWIMCIFIAIILHHGVERPLVAHLRHKFVSASAG